MNIRKLLLLVAATWSISSCDWVEDLFNKEKDEALSKEEIAQISEDAETISLTARDIVANPPVDTAQVEALLEEYRQLASVEDAWLDKGGIVIKFKKSGLFFYDYPQVFEKSPYFDVEALEKQVSQIAAKLRSSAVTDKILPENKKVAMFCSLYDRSFERYSKMILEALERDLENANVGYEVETYYDEDFTLEQFKQALNQSAVIIVFAHGSISSDYLNAERITSCFPIVSFESGKRYSEREFWDKYTDDFNNMRVTATVLEGDITVVGITEKYFEYHFKDGSLPNTLFYTLSCYGLDNDMALARILQNKRKGKGATIGYSDTNGVGHEAAWFLFEGLMSGYTVGEAFTTLIPNNYLENKFITDEGREVNAKLLVYPQDEGYKISLIETKSDVNVSEPVSVQILSPEYGSNLLERVIELSGFCNSFDKITNAEVTVSSSSGNYTEKLMLVNSNYVFTQKLVINQGENKIKVTCYGYKDNVPVAASDEVTVTGSFSPLPLWTSLQWDTDGTDVDLHLFGPDDSDCYWKQPNTIWGGALDVDDRDGYGPEHITIPTLRTPGVYKLYAYYYGGNVATNAWVTVSTQLQNITFGPHLLTKEGDLWEVCTITFPSAGSGGIIQYNSLKAGEVASPLKQYFMNMPKK